MRRSLATAAFAALCAAAAVPPTGAAPAPGPPAAEERSPLVRLPATRPEHLWVEVTPLAWNSRAKVFHPATPATAATTAARPTPTATTLALAGVPEGMAMVCAGADGRASRCERALLAEAGVVELPDLPFGMRVAGRLLLGRLPAAGFRLSVAPAGLISRRAFTVPLARAQSGEGLVREAISGADGRFTLPPLAPGRYVLEAQAAGSLDGESDPFTVPAPGPLVAKDGEPPSARTLALADWILAEGVQLPVRVADAAGAPIAGAEVAALEDDATGARSVSAARTDPAGRAILSRLDPNGALDLGCSAAGYVSSHERFERVPPDAGCRLLRQGALAGQVVGDDGKPFRGATLTLDRGHRTAASDAAGAFRFDALPPGRYRLVAAAPGFRALAAQAEVAAGGESSAGVLRLSPAGRLFGQAVDAASGDPVAGAEVEIVEPAGGASAATGDDGTFSLAAGADFPLGLEIRAEGYPVKRAEISPETRTSEEAPWVVELSHGGRVQAVVWSEETDAPCLGCTVEVVRPSTDPERLTTDANGEATSELLDPGVWSAYLETAESSGSTVSVHTDAVRSVTVAAGAVSRLEFGRHATLRIRFSAPLPAGWMLSATSAATATRSSVAAGADGTFVVRRPPGEELTLDLVDGSSHRAQQAVVPADYAEPELALSLPSTEVDGTLARGDQPAPNLRVTLLGAAGGGDLASALADDRGAFEIPYAAPGMYVLEVDGKPIRTVELRGDRPLDLGAVPLQP